MINPIIEIFIKFDYDISLSNNDSYSYRRLRQGIQFIAGEIFRER